MKPKIILTGGGTGGHVFPALALCEAFSEHGWDVLYVGSPTGLEAKLAPEKGVRFVAIRSGAVKNQSLFRILRSLTQVFLAVFQCIRLLRQEKPDAILGVGGYVSVPVCSAGFLLRIPIYLQEQNVSVGIANRFLGRLSQKIFLGFPHAKRYFPASRCIVTGNPIRSFFFNGSSQSYNPSGSTLLILGGSQGAQAINRMITKLLPKIEERHPAIRIVHQTGPKDVETTRAEYQKQSRTPHEVVPFIDDMASAYGSASLVVSRSGALTVSELLRVGRPAIFIPYPRKGQNDQTANAYLLASQGIAEVVEQGPEFEERFWESFERVFKPEKLAEMAQKSAALRTENAVDTIVRFVESSKGRDVSQS